MFNCKHMERGQIWSLSFGQSFMMGTLCTPEATFMNCQMGENDEDASVEEGSDFQMADT